MKKVLLLMICAVSVCACKNKSDDSSLIVRRCGDYMVQMHVSEDGEKMAVRINGDDVILQNVVSASGAKYDGVLNDTNVTMWGKGGDWILMLDDDMIIECSTESE